ncbi:MAG: LPS export ABC transporter periplasmic protein LptC [Hyphomicrobium sp.]|uniref:LPS export ABC transporter periplasmic protein LptC n=1 Tax=Hyphomicrobium sp. TaxID=82 RepID=UPI0013221044|nr:LPS export ABC transporter periplasmic protein LptC [Hyphomicrobium sp.]KAB2942533.1 MAG: LPS export ABC transporter periplasmic protein LptC [Hyphomicrobium sp.]MBZ0208503.1 LPS export ABC transporter periplasmic protein LptC [Hyphomicrobium sp.]
MATTTHFASGETWTGSDPFAGTTAADRARNFARARRHTRLVRALRWSLPGAGVGIVVLYFVMILDTTGWVAGLPHLEVPRIIPDNLTMDNPSYEGFNKDGGKYVVRAKTAVQDLVNTQFVRLNGITGDMTDANKSKTHLTAAHGEFNTKTNQLDLSGGIDIVADSGLKAKLSRATILTNDNVIFSKEPVVVDMPSGTIRSNEMRLLNKSREIAFIDDVKAHLVPEKGEAAGTPTTGATKPAAPLIGGGEGPIDITANRLDIDDTGKTATFTGNVKAQQADAALETAALEVRYEGGETGATGAAATPGAGAKIQRIVSKSPVVMTRAPQDRVTGSGLDYDAVNQVAVVSGNVEMTSGPERHASADKVTVDQRADTILLTGSVVATQGRNELKGERLYVERATGRTQLSSPAAPGDDPGRIFTRFYRGEAGAPQTATEKVKQLADAATGAAAGAATMFKTDPTAPIDVEAGHLDVDDRSKQAVFRSDVRAVQGDFIVRTSELRAYYTGAAGLAEQGNPADKKTPAQVTRIEARGKVIVTSSKNGQNATGDWADYDVKKNQVLLGGDVILTQGKNVVRGTKLTIDMLTGESVIDSDGSGAWAATAAPDAKNGGGFTMRPGTAGRPSAIFYPRDKKAAEKKPSAGASDGAGSDGGWAPANPSR